MAGLVLVFDLDQTLIDTNSFIKPKSISSALFMRRPAGENSSQGTSVQKADPEQEAKPKGIAAYLNTTLIDTVLRPAVQLRNTNRGVDCIFLLSNNSNEPYIEDVIRELNKYLGLPEGKSVFNSYMSRYDSYREGADPQNPEKRLKDVKNMLGEVLTNTFEHYSTENLAERTYFFDDLATHTIRKEIAADHYFVIEGGDGFTVGKPDSTDYSAITGILTARMTGGRRKYRKKTRKHKRRCTRKRGKRIML